MMERTAKLFAAFLTACCGTVQAESLDEDSLATLLAAEADAKIARAQLEEAEDAVREAELEVSAAVAVVEAASAELTQSDSGSSRLAYGFVFAR